MGQPALRYEEYPSPYVIRGGKPKVEPLNPVWFSVAKFIVVMCAVLCIFGMALVCVRTAVVYTTMNIDDIESNISDIRAENSVLEYKLGRLSELDTIEAKALSIGMCEPEETMFITLTDDVVKKDANGNLSLALSLDAAAKQVKQ